MTRRKSKILLNAHLLTRIKILLDIMSERFRPLPSENREKNGENYFNSNSLGENDLNGYENTKFIEPIRGLCIHGQTSCHQKR